MRKLLAWIAGIFRRKRGGELYYIGGSDVLPPPLKGQEEQDALEQSEQGSDEAKQKLIEHNLRLVVYIARRFENTGVNLGLPKRRVMIAVAQSLKKLRRSAEKYLHIRRKAFTKRCKPSIL